MPQTFAETWRATKPAVFHEPLQYLHMIMEIDPLARGEMTDLGVVIKFSDGSLHRMDNDRPRKVA